MNTKNKLFFSIVTSLYNSAAHIEEFCWRTRKAVESITDRYEIIFVNDGSPDDSLKAALRLQQQNAKIIILDLSRNFGQHKANMTGLEHAKGDYIFLIEADLEEEPEWIIDFYDQLTSAEDIDVIFGLQEQRKGGYFERVSGGLFYKIFNMFSDVKIPENHITVRLMTRRYVRALTSHKERELFIGGLYELAGFRQKPCLVTKLSHSETTYSFIKKLKLLVNAITSFSVLPLWFIFWVGFFTLLFSSCVISYVVLKWLFSSIAPGWTTTIASIWAVGGLIMMSIGMIGIYLKKVLEEVKDRPYTIIKHEHKIE